jgi:hypothetical protein
MSDEISFAQMEVAVAAWKLEEQILTRATDNVRIKHQRKGQALMNALKIEAPDLYEIISGSMIDCFHDDSKVTLVMVELGFVRRHF